jgi:hypothetical protein
MVDVQQTAGGATADAEGEVVFDFEGALAVARGLRSLAAAAEAAFDRRDRAAAEAAGRWAGPMGSDFERLTRSEADRCREVVSALRAEADAWASSAVAAAGPGASIAGGWR